MAHELVKIKINENHKYVTLDIKDLYTDLLTKEIIHITRNLLTTRNATKYIIKQCLNLFQTILSQTYFNHEDKYYDHNKVVVMGSPISSTTVKICLQHYTMGWTVQGSNPSKGETFCTHPDRCWGPHSLLYNGYWVIPGGKAAEAWHQPPSPF